MAKDSQLDPKEVRKQKSDGKPSFADEAPDGEGRNAKKQSVKKNGFQSNK